MLNRLIKLFDELTTKPETAHIQREMNKVDLAPTMVAQHIHNLEGYFEISEKNSKRWKQLNKILHRRYGYYFSEELFKEIAADAIFKTLTINEIEDMITEYEKIPKIEV